MADVSISGRLLDRIAREFGEQLRAVRDERAERSQAVTLEPRVATRPAMAVVEVDGPGANDAAWREEKGRDPGDEIPRRLGGRPRAGSAGLFPRPGPRREGRRGHRRDRAEGTAGPQIRRPGPLPPPGPGPAGCGGRTGCGPSGRRRSADRQSSRVAGRSPATFLERGSSSAGKSDAVGGATLAGAGQLPASPADRVDVQAGDRGDEAVAAVADPGAIDRGEPAPLLLFEPAQEQVHRVPETWNLFVDGPLGEHDSSLGLPDSFQGIARVDDQPGVLGNPLPVVSGVIRGHQEAITRAQVISSQLLACHA